MNQAITVLSITAISIVSVLYGADYAKEILIAAVAGLVGYLSGEKR